MEKSPLEQYPSNDFQDIISSLVFFQNNPDALRSGSEEGLQAFFGYLIRQLQRWNPSMS